VLAPTTHLIRKRREELNIHKAMEALQEVIHTHAHTRLHTPIPSCLFQENKLKNGRALKTAVKERELARQKAANLLTLRQELKALTKEREKIGALVEKHEIYPRFLDKVVKASKQESRWAHIQNSATTKAMLLGTIKMATANLYQTTSKKAQDGWGEVALKDTLKQLDKVQKFLSNLICIWEEVNQVQTTQHFQP
uniref:DUF4200 domain-containing protein n=1 Tax=Oncorhynchus tshawytscha TaxID=74940 RepID=A0AAZ3S9K9_ONCTS